LFKKKKRRTVASTIFVLISAFSNRCKRLWKGMVNCPV
jgi:hypothetical protein